MIRPIMPAVLKCGVRDESKAEEAGHAARGIHPKGTIVRNLARSIFFLLLGAGAVYIMMSSAGLPEKVASSFGRDNLATGYMTREGYRIWMLAFGILLPLVVVLLTAWIPRRAPQRMRLPRRDHWFAPEHWDQMMASVSAQIYWIGSLITLFVIGLHYAIIEANVLKPAQISARTLWLLFVTFIVCMIALIVGYAFKFRRAR